MPIIFTFFVSGKEISLNMNTVFYNSDFEELGTNKSEVINALELDGNFKYIKHLSKGIVIFPPSFMKHKSKRPMKLFAEKTKIGKVIGFGGFNLSRFKEDISDNFQIQITTIKVLPLSKRKIKVIS